MADDKDAPFKAQNGCGALTALPDEALPEAKEAPESCVNKEGLWYWVPDDNLGWVEAMKCDGNKYLVKGPQKHTHTPSTPSAPPRVL